MTISILILICIGAIILQGGYLGVLLLKIYRHHPPKIQLSTKMPVSVIICARNEGRNLREHLPMVLQQKYPNYEVLVVNDGSTDDTGRILQHLSTLYNQLRYINISDEDKKYPGKKGALAHGIAAANHEFLLLTDADCQPASERWMEKMVLPLHSGVDLVLGVSPYLPGKGLINKLVRYETLLTAIQYVGLALWGLPYMSVGRNVAYTRELFNKVNGFEGLTKTASGDDDLFIQKVKKNTAVGVVLEEQAFTWSATPGNISSWWKQKTRHYSTGFRYRPQTLCLLGIFYLSKLIFWIAAVNLMLTFFIGGVIICGLLHILCLIMARPLALKLKTDILWQFLLLDLLYIVTVTLAGWTSLLKKNYSWK